MVEQLTLGVVIVAALLDSINPCVFGVLIFLIAFMTKVFKSPRKMLVGGLFYTAVVYLTYFFIGLGILKFTVSLGLSISVYWIAAIIALIIYFERSYRRIPVQYAKRIVGRKMYGGQESHLPLKLNMSGVIPPIFASSLILFPATVAQFVKNDYMQSIAAMLSTGWVYDFMYAGLIIFFCYFYTAVTFNPVDVADNMRKFGGYVPGIRPGSSTSDYIDGVLTRITVGGALYITFICLLPSILIAQFGIPGSLASTFGGTSLLIVVGVAMDTVAQVETHLLSRHYDGFLGSKMGGRFKGRKG